MKITLLPLNEFSLNLIFEYFRKFVEIIQVWLKSEKNDGYFYMKTNKNLWKYFPEFLLELEMFPTKFLNQNTEFFF
jgi:hypothetical protein